MYRWVALALVMGTVAGCASPARTTSFVAGKGAAPETCYFLPFEAGTRRICVQGGPGPFSHEGSQRYATDFAMPLGTAIVAVRSGCVVAVREDSDTGGPTEEYAPDGNYVRVRHADGTRATYLHLERDGAEVEVGQYVRRGQTIARSGSTGWSAMPHVHIQVDRRDGCGRWRSVPVCFADVPGGRPRMWRAYVSGNRWGEPVR